MLNGIDVSSYQSATPTLSGLSFVFVKVTEGLSYVNPEWRSQVADARAAGALVGLYHYPHIANSASAEAAYFLQQIGSALQAGDVLILDWEWYGQAATDQQARDYKTGFLAELRTLQPTHRRVLYCNTSTWTGVDTDSNAGDGLWIATAGLPAGQPGIQATWAFHQYTDAAAQGGDGDVANPSLFPSAAALHTWAHGLEPAPSPSPSPQQEAEMPSFTVAPNGLSGVTFPRGSARTVAFFTDNTLIGGSSDPGAKLRVVVWASGKAAEIHDGVVVSNKGSNQTVIDFSDPANTHSVTVTREDGKPYPVFGEVS